MEKICEFPLKSDEKSRDIRKNGIKGWKIVFFFPIFRFRTKNAALRLPQGRKWGSLPILRLGKSFRKNRKSGKLFVKKIMLLCSIFCENTIFQMYFCISPLHSPPTITRTPSAPAFKRGLSAKLTGGVRCNVLLPPPLFRGTPLVNAGGKFPPAPFQGHPPRKRGGQDSVYPSCRGAALLAP